MKEHILNTLNDSRDYLHRFIGDGDNIEAIARAASLMITALHNGNTIYSCGNGGSMSDAMHFAEELTGRYRKTAWPYPQRRSVTPGI